MKKPKIKMTLSEKRAFFKRIKKNLGPKVLKHYKLFIKYNGWSRFHMGMTDQDLKINFDMAEATKGKKFCYIAA